MPARAACTVNNTARVATCTGDLSAGVFLFNLDQITAENLTGNIACAAGGPGVELKTQGANAGINASSGAAAKARLGLAGSTTEVTTQGEIISAAPGLAAVSVGVGLEAELYDRLVLSAGFDGLLSGDQQIYMGNARLSFLF